MSIEWIANANEHNYIHVSSKPIITKTPLIIPRNPALKLNLFASFSLFTFLPLPTEVIFFLTYFTIGVSFVTFQVSQPTDMLADTCKSKHKIKQDTINES